jgi:hypothetical protein
MSVACPNPFSVQEGRFQNLFTGTPTAYPLCIVAKVEGLAPHGDGDHSRHGGTADHSGCPTHMSTAKPKREIDFSLYLVTGRHLLPLGKVRFSLCSCSLLTSPLLRVTWLLWRRSVVHSAVAVAPHRFTTIYTQALRGGVTVVQVREKSTDTAEVRCPDLRIDGRYPLKRLNSSSK